MRAIEAKALFEEIDRLENDFAATLLARHPEVSLSRHSEPRRGEESQGKILPLRFAQGQDDFSKVRKVIFQYHKALELLKRLNAIEITPAEYEALKETLQSLNTQAFAQFIVLQTKKSIVLSRKWEENIQKAIKFYEASQARDRAIEETLDRYVIARAAEGGGWKAEGNEDPKDSLQPSSFDLPPAVLVFGGFHKERIKEILQKQGYSFLVVSPKITQIDPKHQGYYKRLMSIGHHPFETPFNVTQAAKTQPVYSLPNGPAEVRAIYEGVLRLGDKPLPILFSELEGELPKIARAEARTQKPKPEILKLVKRILAEKQTGSETEVELGDFQKTSQVLQQLKERESSARSLLIVVSPVETDANGSPVAVFYSPFGSFYWRWSSFKNLKRELKTEQWIQDLFQSTKDQPAQETPSDLPEFSDAVTKAIKEMWMPVFLQKGLTWLEAEGAVYQLLEEFFSGNRDAVERLWPKGFFVKLDLQRKRVFRLDREHYFDNLEMLISRLKRFYQEKVRKIELRFAISWNPKLELYQLIAFPSKYPTYRSRRAEVRSEPQAFSILFVRAEDYEAAKAALKETILYMVRRPHDLESRESPEYRQEADWYSAELTRAHQINREALLRILLELAGDKTSDARWGALHDLAELKDPHFDYTLLIRRFQREKEDDILRYLVVTLAQIGEVEGVKALIRLGKKPDFITENMRWNPFNLTHNVLEGVQRIANPALREGEVNQEAMKEGFVRLGKRVSREFFKYLLPSINRESGSGPEPYFVAIDALQELEFVSNSEAQEAQKKFDIKTIIDQLRRIVEYAKNYQERGGSDLQQTVWESQALEWVEKVSQEPANVSKAKAFILDYYRNLPDDFPNLPPRRAEVRAIDPSDFTLDQKEAVIALHAPEDQGHLRLFEPIAVAIGRKLGLSSIELQTLRKAGLLHEVGRIGIDYGYRDRFVAFGHQFNLPLSRSQLIKSGALPTGASAEGFIEYVERAIRSKRRELKRSASLAEYVPFEEQRKNLSIRSNGKLPPRLRESLIKFMTHDEITLEVINKLQREKKLLFRVTQKTRGILQVRARLETPQRVSVPEKTLRDALILLAADQVALSNDEERRQRSRFKEWTKLSFVRGFRNTLDEIDQYLVNRYSDKPEILKTAHKVREATWEVLLGLPQDPELLSAILKGRKVDSIAPSEWRMLQLGIQKRHQQDRRAEVRAEEDKQPAKEPNYPQVVEIYDPKEYDVRLLVNRNPSGRLRHNHITRESTWDRDDNVIRLPLGAGEAEGTGPINVKWEDLETPLLGQYREADVYSYHNLFYVDWFTVYEGGTGKLLYRRGEPFETRDYTMFVVWKDKSRGVTSEDLIFVQIPGAEPGKVRVYKKSDASKEEDLLGEIETAFFGQRLIHDGVRVPFEAVAHQFDDIYQIYNFPQFIDIERNEDGEIINYNYGPALGITELVKWRGEAPKKFLDVIRKNGLMTIDLTPYLEKGHSLEEIEERALQNPLKNYQKSDKDPQALEIGEYRIEEKTLHARLRPYPYSHNLMGITKGGKIVSIVITGEKFKGIGASIQELPSRVLEMYNRKTAALGITNDPLQEVFLLANSQDALRRTLRDGKPGVFAETGDRYYERTTAAIALARRAEVRKIDRAMVPRFARPETANRFQEKYTVVVDMKVFDALSPEQRSEFYKLMVHYQDGERVKFVFPATGDRQMDTVWEELNDRRAQFGNVEIPINPTGFDFQGRKVIHVSKEGIQGFYAALVEEKLRGSKDFYSVRYKQGTKDPGLLTAALLLLDSGKNEFFQGRSFSDIPQGLGLEHQIQAILGAYIHVGRSA